MLISIGLANFKCFDALRLELPRLTLLTGFNASGKSSSYQPLLLLTQALRGAPRSEFLSLNGPLVRLGTAGEVLSATGVEQVSIEISSIEAKSKWSFRPAEIAGGGVLALEKGALKVNGRPPVSWTGCILPNLSAPNMQQLISAIQDVIYIGAVRIGTADAFPASDDAGISRADVGTRGEYAPWWYAQCADEEIVANRRHRDEPGLTLRRQLDAFLSDLFPGGQAAAEQIPRTFEWPVSGRANRVKVVYIGPKITKR